MARPRVPKAPTHEKVLEALGDFARRLLVDPEYLQKLRNRVIDGLAGDKAETMLINVGLFGIGEKKPPTPKTPAPGAGKKRKDKGRGKVIPIKRPKES